MATEWTFEKAMTRLEQIVATLEGGRCSLDDSLKLFEEGTKLTAYCSKMLKEAEQKIIKLTAAEAGEDGVVLSDRQGENMGEELSE
ncbi:MAG: exodeoxyribonuclease VII small subunit [Clostridia bacterium]|nr:exodeoxyribonuclease VII small subunit [Clostridia bacterium]